jgi:RHS repeat-associated protein
MRKASLKVRTNRVDADYSLSGHRGYRQSESSDGSRTPKRRRRRRTASGGVEAPCAPEWPSGQPPRTLQVVHCAVDTTTQAATAPGPKTRVRGLKVASAGGLWGQSSSTAEAVWGNFASGGESASDQHFLTNPKVIDEVLSFETGGATYYPLTDALGSVMAVADSSGAVVRTNSYDVYGARTTSGTGPEIAYGFTGREHDASGLNYNRDRYLDALRGRWTQPDRKKFQDGPNFFLYAASSPVRFVDPTGTTYVERMRLLGEYAVYLARETKAGRRMNGPGPFIDFMAAFTFLESGMVDLVAGDKIRTERIHPCGEQAADLIDHLSGFGFTDYRVRYTPVEGRDGVSAHQWVLVASKADNEVLLLDPFLGAVWSRSYFEQWDAEPKGRPVLPSPQDEFWSRIFVY